MQRGRKTPKTSANIRSPTTLPKPTSFRFQDGLQLIKDHAKVGNVAQVIQIKPLYYPTLDELVEEACNQVMCKCHFENVSFNDNPLPGRIGFEWRNATLNLLSFDKYFFIQLGLGTQQMKIFSKPLYSAPSRKWGDCCASLTDVETLFIYSDGIDYQNLGLSKSMLMAVFPSKGSNGEQQSWQFNPF